MRMLTWLVRVGHSGFTPSVHVRVPRLAAGPSRSLTTSIHPASAYLLWQVLNVTSVLSPGAAGRVGDNVSCQSTDGQINTFQHVEVRPSASDGASAIIGASAGHANDNPRLLLGLLGGSQPCARMSKIVSTAARRSGRPRVRAGIWSMNRARVGHARLSRSTPTSPAMAALRLSVCRVHRHPNGRSVACISLHPANAGPGVRRVRRHYRDLAVKRSSPVPEHLLQHRGGNPRCQLLSAPG